MRRQFTDSLNHGEADGRGATGESSANGTGAATRVEAVEIKIRER